MNLEKLVPMCLASSHRCIPGYGSAESIADSDLEDGELRTMLASPLYLQNREDYESFRMPIAMGNLLHCFHLEMKNREIISESSVFRNADPSNVGRNLNL